MRMIRRKQGFTIAAGIIVALALILGFLKMPKSISESSDINSEIIQPITERLFQMAEHNVPRVSLNLSKNQPQSE